MTSNPIRIETGDDIATIILDRPDQGNIINGAMAEALLDAAISCDRDASIRCVVLTGTGRLFCGGGDLLDMRDAGDDKSAYLSKLAGILHLAVVRLQRMAKPLVVAVNGPAAGAGMSLGIAGDIVLAARSAHFTTAYDKVGLSPDGGMSWFLPRLVGMRRAQELLLSGRRVSAQDALEIGLVTQVVDDDALLDEAARTARMLADSAVRAAGRAKALLLETFDNSLEGQLEAELRAITESGSDAESNEGVAAFLAKRRPNFSGAK